jgi:hypothetical protein
MPAFSHLELMNMAQSPFIFCCETLTPAERLSAARRYMSALGFYQGGFSAFSLTLGGSRSLDAQCIHILGHYLVRAPTFHLIP